jgi:ABC-type branched-subunit amino acid transport system ATPase component/phenylacetate-coenzyme A ligase PaaK-like adenylate-forming protein
MDGKAAGTLGPPRSGAVASSPLGNTLLEVEQLNVSYGPIEVLHQVSLEVKAGEIVSVVGANGMGKSTLLKAISGVIKPRSGVIRFQGRSLVGLGPEQIVRLGIGHVPERRELFSSMTVLENLQLGAHHRGHHRGRGDARDEIERDLEMIWEMFPILHSRRKQVAGTLSGGEQQMLAIARGLMSRSILLMLDEPTLGLAPLLVQEVLRIVGQLREMGRTVLLVEQNASGALEVADRAYVMEVGRIVMGGSTTDLLQEDRIRRAYLGQRIAPVRRPERVRVAQPMREEHRRIKVRRERQDRGMKEVFPGQLNYTLPDEYFEERLSASAAELEQIQDEALPQAFRIAFERSPLYRHKFEAAGLTPDSVRGLQDLGRLPFTVEDEIRPNPAKGYTSAEIMAVASPQVTAVHRSSGTTGGPKIFGYTGRDMAQWAANVATVDWIIGIRKDDIVLSPGLSREFTGSGGGYMGMLALGATYIPITIGPGISETIVAHLTGKIRVDGREVMLDPLLRANAMSCLASFLPRLLELLDEHGVRPDELALTKLYCGAEPSSDAVRTRIAERLGIWPRDHYGLGELYGPGVAGECRAGGCLHVLSDTFIAEVVDPETGEPTPEGEIGELVLTGLHKEALPIFRFRTGDRVMALPQSCPCGMEHKRIGRVTGRIRTDDIVIPGGMVINRTYLEDVILPIDGAGCEYAVTVADDPQRAGLQRFCIAIEGEGERLADVIAHRFRLEYRYAPVVHVLPRGTIPRGWGKVKRHYSPEEYRALVRPFYRI